MRVVRGLKMNHSRVCKSQTRALVQSNSTSRVTKQLNEHLQQQYKQWQHRQYNSVFNASFHKHHGSCECGLRILKLGNLHPCAFGHTTHFSKLISPLWCIFIQEILRKWNWPVWSFYNQCAAVRIIIKCLNKCTFNLNKAFLFPPMAAVKTPKFPVLSSLRCVFLCVWTCHAHIWHAGWSRKNCSCCCAALLNKRGQKLPREQSGGHE